MSTSPSSAELALASSRGYSPRLMDWQHQQQQQKKQQQQQK